MFQLDEKELTARILSLSEGAESREDFWTKLASEAENIPVSEVTPEHRRFVKAEAFRLLYSTPFGAGSIKK